MNTKHAKANRKQIPILVLDGEPVSVPVLRQGSYTRNPAKGLTRFSDPGAAVEKARSGPYDLALLLSVMVHALGRMQRLLLSH